MSRTIVVELQLSIKTNFNHLCFKIIFYTLKVKVIYVIIHNSTEKGIKPMLLDEITILFVDNDHNTRNMIGALLKSYCEEVFLATTGEEGLKIYKDILK